MAKGDWRDQLGKKLFGVLDTYGTDKFLEVSCEMLGAQPKGGKGVKGLLNGEVCELVIIGLTQQYIKLAEVRAKAYHSVVLKDLKNIKGDFRTELDFVLVTPYFLLTSECKSYYGDIQVTGNCTLSHAGRDTDVYKQSKLHHKNLMEYSKQLMLPGKGVPTPPVYANAFVFSNGNIKDLRTPEQKKTLRILTTSSLVSYYEAMFKKFKTSVFDYERACRIFEKCANSEKLHQEHKDFLGY